MEFPGRLILAAAAMWASAAAANGEIRVVTSRLDNDNATAGFEFNNLARPLKNDAAAQAVFTIVDGRKDNNSGGVAKLCDGQVPGDEDDPAANFFFAAGTDGGRLLVDLGAVIQLQQVNTYSWHANTRAPQVYGLYGSDGQAAEFKDQPKKGTVPEAGGWKLIAQVDTRPKEGHFGGQYGVSISATHGIIGSYRFLLFDIFRTEDADAFSNTFFSEIDVLDRNAPAAPEPVLALSGREKVVTEDGRLQIVIDTSATPGLREWAHQELAPVVRTWYPTIIKMLPSEGFSAPQRITITFDPNIRGVAATGGSRIRCAADWIQRNLNGEARGSIVHEMVHVVQYYGRGRSSTQPAKPAPGWLVEGIADYIRWFLFEPESHGAEVRKDTLSGDGYKAGYRVTANFLNWMVEKQDPDFIAHLNATLREGRYSEDLWKQRTGRSLPELGAEWKAGL